jgi:uncharacterized phage protein (TIGR02218 family)
VTLYPPALVSHLGQDVTTLCHCWKLTRTDGVVFGFTDHDRPLTVDGLACKPETGLVASEARRTLGLGLDTVDVEGALSSLEIDGEDIAIGKYDGAVIETFLVNWESPSDFVRLRKSTIAKLTYADGRFLAELQSAMRALDKPNGRHIIRNCDAELGDGRCKMALVSSTFTGSGAVAAVAPPDAVLVIGLGAYADNWFSLGRLTWTSGALVGVTDLIRSHRKGDTSHRIVFQMDGRPAPQVGDTFSVVAGCDKLFSTCKAKFDNHENFRGFPHLPGNDSAYSYVSDEGVFDGGPIVP